MAIYWASCEIIWTIYRRTIKRTPTGGLSTGHLLVDQQLPPLLENHLLGYLLKNHHQDQVAGHFIDDHQYIYWITWTRYLMKEHQQDFIYKFYQDIYWSSYWRTIHWRSTGESTIWPSTGWLLFTTYYALKNRHQDHLLDTNIHLIGDHQWDIYWWTINCRSTSRPTIGHILNVSQLNYLLKEHKRDIFCITNNNTST